MIAVLYKSSDFSLDIRETRTAVFDGLTDCYERNGWPEHIIMARPSASEDKGMESESASLENTEVQFDAPNLLNFASSSDLARNTGRAGGRAESAAINVQKIVQVVIQTLERNRATQFEMFGGSGQISRTVSGAGSGSHSLTSQN